MKDQLRADLIAAIEAATGTTSKIEYRATTNPNAYFFAIGKDESFYVSTGDLFYAAHEFNGQQGDMSKVFDTAAYVDTLRAKGY